MVGDWAVEFLPANSDLEQNAIAKAVRFDIEGAEAWVMTAEHLAAICLQTGRIKDRYRILAFIDQQAVNLPNLNSFSGSVWLEIEMGGVRAARSPGWWSPKSGYQKR